MIVQNFKKGHLAQHIESLDIDTSKFTEYDYRRQSSPINSLPSMFALFIKHNLYLYDFKFKVEERFDSPRLTFSFCGEAEDILAYSIETNTVNPTEEELEQARLRDKKNPDYAEFFNE